MASLPEYTPSGSNRWGALLSSTEGLAPRPSVALYHHHLWSQTTKRAYNLVRKGVSHRKNLRIPSKISVEKFFQRLFLQHLYSMEKKKRLRNEYRALPKGYYHFCTDGWQEGRLFNKENQYVSAMTSLAIMTVKYNIDIYGFVLMPNHVHILLSGTGEDCLNAFYLLIRRCARRLRLDGYPPLPDSYWFKLIPVENQESFRSHLLYIARNPYEKGLSNPGGYLWGSDYLIYSDWSNLIRGMRLGDYHRNHLIKLIDCIKCPNKDWEIHPRLGILARNFVKTEMTYKLFPTAKTYMTRLIKDYETFVHISDQLEEEPTLSDTEIRDIIYSLSSHLYPDKLYKQLTPDEKIRIAVAMVDRYKLPVSQIASAIFINERTLQQALQSKAYGPSKFNNRGKK